MYNLIIGLWVLWSIYAVWRIGSLRHDHGKLEEDLRAEHKGKTRRIDRILHLEAENQKQRDELDALRKHDQLRKICRNHGLKIHEGHNGAG